MSSYKTVLDVSCYNTITSWTSISKNVDAVIIRAGYRGYGSTGTLVTDKNFATYIKAASEAGIPLSVYFFTQAKTVAEAEAEANYTVNLIKNYTISLPIFIDSEYGNNNQTGRADSLSKTTRTNAVKAFCDKIIELGYSAGVYASDDWFNSNLNVSSLTDYSLWVAKYSTTSSPKYVSNYVGWQYTSTGSITGVSGDCDLSKWYGAIGESIGSTVSVEETTTTDTSTTNTTTSDTSFSAGDKISLSNAPLYASSTTKTSKNSLDGTYYIWNNTIINNRIRVTTSKANVGKNGRVTGWVDVSDAIKIELDLKGGDRLDLSKVDIYADSTALSPSGKVTGTYYTWSAEIVNGRIRITNSAKRVGVKGQTTGWINVSDI